MNKADLILEVAENTDVPASEVGVVVEELLATIEKELVKGNQIKILGFGILYKKQREARKGTSPTTHEHITIPASATVGFKPSKILMQKINK